MKTKTLFLAIAAAFTVTACGGGGGGSEPISDNDDLTPTPSKTTPGVWQGTVTSSTTGTSSVVGLTNTSGHSVWMTTDGRVWDGQMPMTGTQLNVNMTGYMYPGRQFPDGTNFGMWSLMGSYAHGTWSGQFNGTGDRATFSLSMHPGYDRPASLDLLAGVYTRSTSNGYTMTMTMSANGQLTASDSRGCIFNGAVDVPDATHNMYRINATVTSCGSLDGTYSGMGALLDADAMQAWMTAMHPLEHGGHSHGDSMMGGSRMMGHNTVPTGQHNLFMFSMVNDHSAIMDALAR